MIIGNGDIASALKEVDRDDLLFFASGVSNSLETDEAEYQRELDLLSEQDAGKHLVYFSSLAVFYSTTRYAKHKRDMENQIKLLFDDYTIVRLGNITWGDNPHTLINFIRNRIKKGKPFEVQDTHRYIVDKDEFLHWMSMIPDWNCEMNITGRRMKVAEIVRQYGYA